MLPLRWTEHAVTQLEGVVDYISATSPVYAEGVVLSNDQRLQVWLSQRLSAELFQVSVKTVND